MSQYPEFDVDAFLVRFPEFRSAGSPLIEQALIDAAAQCDPGLFGTLHEQAVHCLAADWLHNHKMGQSQRSDEDGSKPSRYKVMYDQVFSKRAIRMIVI